MSISAPLSPRGPDQLAFLPHPHAPISPGLAPLNSLSTSPPSSWQAQINGAPHRSPRSRPRSSTSGSSSLTSTSPRIRSAPASPSGRTIHGGLAPLSVISPIRLSGPLPDPGYGLALEGTVNQRQGVGQHDGSGARIEDGQGQAGQRGIPGSAAMTNGAHVQMNGGQALQRPTAAVTLPIPAQPQAQTRDFTQQQPRPSNGGFSLSNNGHLQASADVRHIAGQRDMSGSSSTSKTAQDRASTGDHNTAAQHRPAHHQRVASQPVGYSMPMQYQQQRAQQQQQQQQRPVNGVPFPMAGPSNGVGTAAGLAQRPKPRLLRSRSRTRQQSGASGTSGSETETGMDSDTTLMPGRSKKTSLSQSQPDLVALRSRLEGWAGDVALHNANEGVARLSLHENGTVAKGVEHRNQQPESGLALPARRSSGSSSIPIPIRRGSGGRTPPSHFSTLPNNATFPSRNAGTRSPGKSPSRSLVHLSSLRLSPVNSTVNVPGMRHANTHPAAVPTLSETRSRLEAPFSPNSGYAGSNDSFGSARPIPVGVGAASSEDADDSLDSASTGDISSPSSGSLSFAPRRKELKWRGGSRGREGSASGLGSGALGKSSSLGLSFGEPNPGLGDFVDKRLTSPSPIHAATQHRVVRWLAHLLAILGMANRNMFSLRLLAGIPAVWGWMVLMQAVITGGLWVDVYPWGIDTSREALDRLILGGKAEGTWKFVERGDMLLASMWAILTGHFCFEMTTGLTHRWRVYYDFPATITRLLSIQCICWPLTGLTLWVLGHERTLFAWVVIGVTTAASRSVQMYVTSNIPSGTGTLGGGVISTSSSNGNGNGSGSGEPGDITPRRSAINLDGRTLDQGKLDKALQMEKGWWSKFKVDRNWNWDAVAREVGWKVGGLLLLTCAWLFWGIEMGRWRGGKYPV